MDPDDRPPTPPIVPAGVHRAWRSAAVGLAAGVTAFAVLGYARRAASVGDGVAAPVQQVWPNPAEADPRLDRRIDAVDFDDRPFAEAVRWMVTTADLNVDCRWRDIEAAGVGRTASITLHLRRVPVRQALDEIVHAMADTGEPLAWASRAGVVTLSSRAALDRGEVVARVYDVGPLLDAAAIDDATYGPNWPPPWNGSQAAGPPPMSLQAARVWSLQNYVQRSVEPTSWQDGGGDVGRMTYFDRRLTVWQTERAHDQIARLFEALRPKR